MIIDSSLGLKGRYKAVVIGPDMDIRRESEWSDNVVTNLGVQMILGGAGVGSNSIFNVQCSCGSGNSTPSVNDTQISAFIAGTLNSISRQTVKNSTVSPYYVMHRIVWRFDVGQAAGNVAELCVTSESGVPTASSAIFSRALVRDSAGNPTAISVHPDEYLEVTYELYIYVPNEVTGTFLQDIDGVSTSFDYTVKTAGMNAGGTPGNNGGWPAISSSAIPRVFGASYYGAAYTGVGTLGPITGGPSGTKMEMSGSTSATGVYSSKYRDITFTCGPDAANATFYSMTLPFTLGAVQMRLSSPIEKINTKTYTITFRVTLDNTI